MMFRYFYIFILSFATVFASLLLSGLFSSGRPAAVHVIYSIPLYMCSFAFLLTTFAHALFSSPGRILGRLPILLSLSFLAAGYWMGGLMSYSLEAVVTEGQRIVMPGSEGVFRPVYVGKYARIPQITLTLNDLRPRTIPENEEALSHVEARFMIQGQDGSEINIELNSRNGFSIKGYRVSIKGLGYSPRYELKGSDGIVLDSSFVYLGLFPHGREDFFRLLSPLTYYISYYPEAGDRPYFNVRVVRNRDVVYNGQVPLGGGFDFENASMFFPEIRRWTKIRVDGNPGRPFLAMGLVMLLVAGIVEFRGRARREGGGINDA